MVSHQRANVNFPRCENEIKGKLRGGKRLMMITRILEAAVVDVAKGTHHITPVPMSSFDGELNFSTLHRIKELLERA